MGQPRGNDAVAINDQTNAAPANGITDKVIRENTSQNNSAHSQMQDARTTGNEKQGYNSNFEIVGGGKSGSSSDGGWTYKTVIPNAGQSDFSMVTGKDISDPANQMQFDGDRSGQMAPQDNDAPGGELDATKVESWLNMIGSR